MPKGKKAVRNFSKNNKGSNVDPRKKAEIIRTPTNRTPNLQKQHEVLVFKSTKKLPYINPKPSQKEPKTRSKGPPNS